jgi:hypothetical protein
MGLLCSDQLFVQNQVNRPLFTAAELEHAIRCKALDELALDHMLQNPNMSPRELLVQIRAIEERRRRAALRGRKARRSK